MTDRQKLNDICKGLNRGTKTKCTVLSVKPPVIKSGVQYLHICNIDRALLRLNTSHRVANVIGWIYRYRCDACNIVVLSSLGDYNGRD